MWTWKGRKYLRSDSLHPLLIPGDAASKMRRRRREEEQKDHQIAIANTG
jgi:hypothetical protein